MSELYDQIVQDRGSFERLLARIPGFRGYVDKASRRTADRMIRDAVADALKQRINRLVELENRLLDDGGLSYMSKTSSVKTKLQTYRDRVRAAAPGYSGFMEAIKVEADELDRLYNFDDALMRYADRFTEALNGLETAVQNKQGIDEAITTLNQLTIEANEAFSLRETVLTDLDRKSF
jgi:uncharacterized phage infection (PIP) family protein YhgE